MEILSPVALKNAQSSHTASHCLQPSLLQLDVILQHLGRYFSIAFFAQFFSSFVCRQTSSKRLLSYFCLLKSIVWGLYAQKESWPWGPAIIHLIYLWHIILQPRVRIPSTPSMPFPSIVKFSSSHCEKDINKQKRPRAMVWLSWQSGRFRYQRSAV